MFKYTLSVVFASAFALGTSVSATGCVAGDADEVDTAADRVENPPIVANDPPWNPSEQIHALGRVRPDGTSNGYLYPGSLNVASVELLDSQMFVRFEKPMSDANYVVLTSEVSAAEVVSFLPIYVPTSIATDGFRVDLYNLKGDPCSWNTPTNAEIAFVVY